MSRFANPSALYMGQKIHKNREKIEDDQKGGSTKRVPMQRANFPNGNSLTQNANSQKNPRVRKIWCPQFWGRKWLRQFYGHLENAFFLQEKPMSIKFLILGGGGYFGFWGGGGGADFIFMGAGIFF